MMLRHSRMLSIAMVVGFTFSGCGTSDRSVKEGFARRIEYLRTMPRIKGKPYYGDHRADSGTHPKN